MLQHIFVPDCIPLYFAKVSMPSADLECGKLLISVSYISNARTFLLKLAFVREMKKLGLKGCFKFHSLDDKTSKHIKFFTFESSTDLAAVRALLKTT